MLPVARETIELGLDQCPILIVEIDVEEEFDWDEPFSRHATSIDAIRDLPAIQPLFHRFEVKPTLLIDYAIANQDLGFESVAEMAGELNGEIGAHQHPWLCPPLEEPVDRLNSFAGNLPSDLEAAKLRVLAEIIERNLGTSPRAYKAGRYGLGANTQRILEEAKFEVDLSPNPPFDFSAEGGPDYSGWSIRPFWFGIHKDMLGIPHSGSFLGILRRFETSMQERVSSGIPGKLKLMGVLARLRAFDRLHLSPEGFSASELRRLARSLLREGARVLTFSFHSPSLRPGCTPYVRSAEDLRTFLQVCEDFFEFFRGEIGGQCMTASELRQHILQTSPRSGQ